jgi:hypothetical protein
MAWSAPLVLTLASSTGAPGDSAGLFDDVGLEGFAQTHAQSIDDYQGRALLIEFFAYW